MFIELNTTDDMLLPSLEILTDTMIKKLNIKIIKSNKRESFLLVIIDSIILLKNCLFINILVSLIYMDNGIGHLGQLFVVGNHNNCLAIVIN